MDARGELYEATAMHLLAFARTLSSSSELCEDAVAETFIEIFRGAGNYTPQKNAYPWMVGILRNKIKQLNAQVPTLITPQDELRAAVQSAADETQSDVHAAIANLEEAERFLVIGYYFFGYSLKELAAMRGISNATAGRKLKTAESHLHRFLS